MATGESGFGSPTLVPPADYPDAGFGDPFDTSFNALARDTGFGSSFDPLLSSIAVDTAEVSMSGGSKVLIYGPFTRGRVYRVSCVSGLLEYDCFSGVNRLSGGICLRSGVLTSYTPALPAGSYALRVFFTESDAVILTNALTALPPFHTAETYMMRKFFATPVLAGDRQALTDRRIAGSLSGLLDSLGTLFNEVSGKPNTFSTADYTYGSDTISVMTTLGFPAAGKLLIGDQVYQYSAKTDKTFTGVSAVRASLDRIDKHTEVSHYDK